MLRYRWGNDTWNDPVAHLRRMQEDMDRLFGSFQGTAATEFPPANVWTGADGAVVSAEVPGVNPEEIEITVHQNTLTLKGRRTAGANSKDVTYHRRERAQGTFGRTFALPYPVDTAKVQASFANGILTIQLPRPEADKPRRIQIATA
ncbi:MAG: Hsp20/alpha crystallin family protein [Alphaproteobacteria bacterium]